MKIKKIKAKPISYGGKRSLYSVLYIVIHYTAGIGDTAINCGNYFATINNRQAGAHFFVGQDGTVVKSIDMSRIAWAVGGNKYSDYKETGGAKYYKKCTNANSISIELCDNLKRNPSKAQKQAVSELIDYIQKHCPNAKTVIRHFDVTGKYCVPTDETELLTPNGWVYLKDIKKGDKVCEYDSNTDTTRFAPVIDVVEPYVAEVYENHNFTATKDHRMYVKPNCVNSKNYRDKLWGDIIDGKGLYSVKAGASIETSGLPLNDNQIRLLVWIQGDGYYIDDGKVKGIEFHLKKKRKIERICNLLEEMDIEYNISECKDKSLHIRVYRPNLIEWAEKWLENKLLTYKLLDMDDAQFKVFYDEMLQVDGCKSGKNELYTSFPTQNLDVVQALCATHGVRTNKQKLGQDFYCAVSIAKSNYTFSGKAETNKRNAVVSCVTVPSGYILVRQKNRTFVVGNCPARMMDNKKWKAFKTAVKA